VNQEGRDVPNVVCRDRKQSAEQAGTRDQFPNASTTYDFFSAQAAMTSQGSQPLDWQVGGYGAGKSLVGCDELGFRMNRKGHV